VKGATIEASERDRERPISAYFKAPQSFDPSPHLDFIKIMHSNINFRIFYYEFTKKCKNK
jgi:hypothetical protein